VELSTLCSRRLPRRDLCHQMIVWKPARPLTVRHRLNDPDLFLYHAVRFNLQVRNYELDSVTNCIDNKAFL